MALGKVNQFSPLALELALPWEVNEEQEADFKDILKKMYQNNIRQFFITIE